MEESLSSFDDFSVEMGDYQMKQVGEWDRMWRISEGGSMDQDPLIMEGKVYFSSFNHNVHCVDARTGELVWKYETRGKIGCSSPVVSEGTLFTGCHDYNMYALDARTGKLAWKFKTQGEIIGTAAVKDGTLYFGSSDQFFYALDARTGRLIWKFKTQGKIFSDPTIVEDKVIFGSFDKNIYCLRRATGELAWKVQTYSEVTNVAPFPVIGSFVYVTGYDNFLRKIEVATGRVDKKNAYAQKGFTTAPVAHGKTMLLSSEDGVLTAIDMDGRVMWKFNSIKPFCNPTVCEGRIYVGGEDFKMHCLTLSGSLVWSFATQDAVFWKPRVWDGKVFFCSYDCHFYAADAATGRLVWKFRTEGSPSTYPPAYDNFELSMTLPEPEAAGLGEKRYDIGGIDEDDDIDGAYKSRITYQVSKQYGAKGKYQVDSDREEF